MSQEQLGKALGVDRNKISEWERGDGLPTPMQREGTVGLISEYGVPRSFWEGRWSDDVLDRLDQLESIVIGELQVLRENLAPADADGAPARWWRTQVEALRDDQRRWTSDLREEVRKIAQAGQRSD